MTQPTDNLATEGAAIVRRLLAPDDAASLRRTVEEIYAVMDSCERFLNKLLGVNFLVWDGVWLEALPAFLRQARPDIAERYEQSLRLVESRIEGVLGPPSGGIFPSAPTSAATADREPGCNGTPMPPPPRSFA